MRQRLAAIYLQVFAFFHKAIKWFESSKLISSLNNSLFGEFDGCIKEIKVAVGNMHREGGTGGLAEGRETRLLAEENNMMLREGDRLAVENNLLLRTYHERFNKLENEVQRALVGRSMNDNLQDMFRNSEKQKRFIIEYRPRSLLGEEERVMIYPEEEERITKVQTKEEIMGYARVLQRFIAPTDAFSLAVSALPVYAEAFVIHALQQWISAEKSRLLWIIGPSEFCTPSAMAPAASNIVASARASDCPVIVHFCKKPTFDIVQSSQNSEETAIIGLVYNLIRQLLQFLSPEVDNRLDLSQERFSTLDGTITSWNKALGLFEELLNSAPPLLLGVIDGLDKLDFKEGSSMCEAFLAVLRRYQQSCGDQKVFKILLTTSGMSGSLGANVLPTERHFAEYGVDVDGDRQDLLMHVSFQ